MTVRLATNITMCTSSWRKGTGLMFRFPRGDFAYIFPFAKPQIMHITMFFVWYSIDIVFVDERNRIVELTSLRPFSSYRSKKKAMTFIELPKGSLQRHGLRVGQEVSWSKKSLVTI